MLDMVVLPYCKMRNVLISLKNIVKIFTSTKVVFTVLESSLKHSIEHICMHLLNIYVLHIYVFHICLVHRKQRLDKLNCFTGMKA